MDKLAAQHSTAATAATAATYATNAEPADSAVPSLAAPPPATADRPAPTQPGAFMAQPAAAPSPPVYRRAWFWVAVSAVVVAGGVAAAFAVQRDDPHSSLRPIDTR